MALPPPDGAAGMQLTGRVALVPATPRPLNAYVETPVLGGAGDAVAAPTAPFTDFVPAEQPVVLELAPLPPPDPAILGAAAPETTEVEATLQFQPTPGEDAVYVLLQEIQTADGMVYDVTLPHYLPADSGETPLLGAGAAGPLLFPVHRLVGDSPPPAASDEAGPLLGGIGTFAADVVFKRTLHLLRAPVAPALQQFVAARETRPRILTVDGGGVLGGPLEGFETWRARFDPAREHRVLLFVHGFLCNADASLPRDWISAFGSHYDAVLAFDHPTISVDPFQNAADLLALIPDDLRLRVDLLAHSRGGLVVRSLVELHPPVAKLKVRRLLTCGAPHAGTALAEYDRWARLVSIGMTAASWALAATGVAAPLAFAPKLMEYLLRAGGQFVLDLPGAAAMIPGSAFLERLNAPDHATLDERLPYAVVTSTFDPLRIPQTGFREALRALAAQAFMGTPNDLVVPTASMQQIDNPIRKLPTERIHASHIDHFAYFDKQYRDVQAFAARFLTS